ncbi:hypothetical protein MAMC_00410 [Methylacidimicrobium cyclopophantes]|uniref:Gamma-butyrobetaine hydroxylase-like N-terminal domain-containing protein n=1 Tax=Methylacidimicrobium cyclopophantes TaxID=1041766 RepID=A0A5E6MBI3_9BACT|nr:DUF971 domain-containing protein [Methylacidimicrobium cyclopophantes]VVM05115.1 hypothetical protein MAMC_00410 [Methylacidimicrobium cyclopophantes]
MSAPLSLVDVQVIGAELAIRWNDGRESFLRLENLRRNCPCALCQGESSATKTYAPAPKAFSPESFLVRSLQPVGGYALQIVWGDGHATGIYPFSYLLSLAEEPSPG